MCAANRLCTPEDAFRCFMGCEIEFLAVGNCILRKEPCAQLRTGVRIRLGGGLSKLKKLKYLEKFQSSNSSSRGSLKSRGS